MVQAAFGGPPKVVTCEARTAAVEQFAKSCGVDLPHARQVAKIAGSLWEQLAAPLRLRAEDRELIEAAALLANVGYLINFERHHKHSYHLILNSGLPGFSPEVLELIANVARYHRGARPKRKHAAFQKLPRTDRVRVRRLAGILRIAGGLDRSHTQQVRDLEVIAPSEREVFIRATSDELPEVDLWGARERTRLFEKTFRATLHFEWQGPRGVDEAATEAAVEGNGRAQHNGAAASEPLEAAAVENSGSAP
jgi:exopolyphosphatase/guanosine-5'-triphosphate,3'-diphosphate pyrophosphatase